MKSLMKTWRVYMRYKSMGEKVESGVYVEAPTEKAAWKIAREQLINTYPWSITGIKAIMITPVDELNKS